MQRVSALRGGDLLERKLPAARDRVAGHRIRWGSVEEIGSPAYWCAQAWMWEIEEPEHYRLGRSLRDETLACLLGGYGIPAEVGLAAYARLREAMDADLGSEDRVLAMLLEPLQVNGRQVRYRFARQKARYVSAAVRGLATISEDGDDRALRDSLVGLPGIGPKTASWIVRNWRQSDDVSILDVHIIRAGLALGIFQPDWRVERHYRVMEDAYLLFARAIGARASILDSVMWMTMRELPSSIVAAMRPKRMNNAVDSRTAAIDSRQLNLI